jgi:hypothetical protein
MTRPTQRKGKKAGRKETSLVEKRMKVADEMAESPTITVTLRIPIKFNEWLDAYRHQSFPERVGKQELVVEGLKLAYVQRGNAKETVLELLEVLQSARPKK